MYCSASTPTGPRFLSAWAIITFLLLQIFSRIPAWNLVRFDFTRRGTKGSTKRTLCGIVLFKLNFFLVEFLRVPSIDSTCFPCTQGLQGINFFLLSTDSTYSRVPGDKGGPIFYRLGIFFGTHFTYKLVYYNLYHVSDFMPN